MKPKVSIIVPVYRAEQYLKRSVSSILNQTFTNFELILVDDGSPDSCPQMCDDLAKIDSRIVVVHKENGGASSARNVGLSVARGDYIGFVDSDDWIEPEMYSDMYNLVVSNNADMAICEIQKENSREKCTNPKVEIWNQQRCFEHFFRVNGENDTHSIWNRLIKKELLINFNFIEGKMNEDVHACYYFAANCQTTIYISAPYYHYTMNLQGVTNSTFTIKKTDLLDIWDIVKNQVNKNFPQYSQVCQKNIERARFTLLMRMYIDGYDKNDKELKNLNTKLKNQVKKDFDSLIRWKMPISRKIFLLLIFLG